MGTAPAFASVGEAMDMAAPRWATWPPRTPPSSPAATQAECLRELERADAVAHGGAGVVPVRVHRRPGLLRRRGLQRAGLADAPDRDHPRRRRRRTRRGPSGPARIRRWWRRWPPGTLSESYGRVICQWTDKLPEKYRERVRRAAAGRGGGRAGAGGPGGAVRGDVRAGPRPTCPMRTRTGSSRTGG